MLGHQERWQDDLFVAGSLRELIPEDHILRRVDRVLDLAWLREAVVECYCEDNGRPGIDPEAAIRLMLAGFLLGIVHDRKLMREAQVNLAIRWFAGYRLHEPLPDHSSLTRIRQRWGEERFREIFARTARSCIDAGIASGEVVHIDATLVRANVSWGSLVASHVAAVVDEDTDAAASSRRKAGKRVSVTDPDASLVKADRRAQAQPSYKQHTAVDDRAGVILDVELTTGETNEGNMIGPHLENIPNTTGQKIGVLTADAAMPTLRCTVLPKSTVSMPSFRPKQNRRRNPKCRCDSSSTMPGINRCAVRPAN